MAYSVEASRNISLGDTAIPNLFIADYLPDVPDGNFVKIYIYAYMCCCQGIAMTHSELASKLGLTVEQVLAAWRYFDGRMLVRKIPQAPGDETHFDVEFVDIKGAFFAKDNGSSAAAQKTAGQALRNDELRTLFEKIAALCESPVLDGDDAQKILRWLDEWDATAAVVESAFRYSKDTGKSLRTAYVGKIVRKWAEKGLRTEADVNDYLASTDIRFGFYKTLMEALGLKYASITEPERKKMDLWLDEYGYSQDALLELAGKTEGKRDKYSYLDGIIRRERSEKAGGGTKAGGGGRAGAADRNEYYRKIRDNNLAAAQAHREEVYGAAPQIRKIDDELLALNAERVKLVTSNARNKEAVWDRLENEVREKTAAKTKLMEKAGFEPEYMAVKYQCKRCEDTGIVLGTGASCDCFDVAPDSKEPLGKKL
jgi:DnaD/phage-associated family protein